MPDISATLASILQIVHMHDFKSTFVRIEIFSLMFRSLIRLSIRMDHRESGAMIFSAIVVRQL